MKKGILILSVLFLTLTAFTTDLIKNETISTNDPCVNIAWDATDRECGARMGDGCTMYQEWVAMNKYYDACTKRRKQEEVTISTQG